MGPGPNEAFARRYVSWVIGQTPVRRQGVDVWYDLRRALRTPYGGQLPRSAPFNRRNGAVSRKDAEPLSLLYSRSLSSSAWLIRCAVAPYSSARSSSP